MATVTKQKHIKSSLTKRRLQNFCKDKMAIVGVIGIVIMMLMCYGAPLLTSHDPARINLRLIHLAPNAEHILGCDNAGRDVWARILYGGQWSIAIGVIASICVNVVGAMLGAIAGYFGGIVDKILVTIQEYISFFPQILIILLIVGLFGSTSVPLLIFIWTVTGWGGTMRIVRGRIMALKQEPYVESCRANGISSASIMFHHMIPNTMGPIIVNMVANVSGYMLQEAALAYLGLGLPQKIPTWGNIINAARRLDIVQMHPILWLAPGIAIGLFCLCMTFFGNGLRDALDPTSR